MKEEMDGNVKGELISSIGSIEVKCMLRTLGIFYRIELSEI